jgi:hypothetical protein
MVDPSFQAQWHARAGTRAQQRVSSTAKKFNGRRRGRPSPRVVAAHGAASPRAADGPTASVVRREWMKVAQVKKPMLRPPPAYGAGGAIKQTDEQIMAQKEQEIESWMRRFAKENGLLEAMNSQPNEAFEAALIKEELEAGTTSVQGLVREELDHAKVVRAQTGVIDEMLQHVTATAEKVSSFSGASGARARTADRLEQQAQKMSQSLASSLSQDYRAAWLEGQREVQCEHLHEKQTELQERFGVHVELDLAKTLSGPPQQRAQGLKSLQNMDDTAGVWREATDEGGALGRALRRARRLGGGGAGSAAAAAAGRDGSDGGLAPLEEDEGGEGEEEEGNVNGSVPGFPPPPPPPPPPSQPQPTPPRSLSPASLHSGLVHLPRTPEGVPSVAGAGGPRAVGAGRDT